MTWSGLFQACADQKNGVVVDLLTGQLDLGSGRSVQVKCEGELVAVGSEQVLTRATADALQEAKTKVARTNRLLHSVLVSHTRGAAAVIVEECAEKRGGTGARLALKAKCEVTSSVQVGAAVQQLVGDRTGVGEDPDLYFGRIERLQRQLKGTKVEVSDVVLVVVALARVPEECAALRTVLDSTPNLQHGALKEQVRTFYRRRAPSKLNRGGASEEKALVVVAKCTFCGKNGHLEAKCWK